MQNQGHDASIYGDIRLNESWRIHAVFRYLRYRLDGTDVDDYDVYIPYLGMSGEF